VVIYSYALKQKKALGRPLFDTNMDSFEKCDHSFKTAADVNLKKV
jgi:hypothetical protein